MEMAHPFADIMCNKLLILHSGCPDVSMLKGWPLTSIWVYHEKPKCIEMIGPSVLLTGAPDCQFDCIVNTFINTKNFEQFEIFMAAQAPSALEQMMLVSFWKYWLSINTILLAVPYTIITETGKQG